MKILKKLFVFTLLVGVYSTVIEPNLLITKNRKIDNLNLNKKIRIIQFSDTQLGDFYSLEDLEKAVDKINKENPDIVVFTGDLIDKANSYNELNSISPILKKIHAPLGKFAVYGNHDYGGGASKYYKNIMNDADFKVLVNSNEKIDIGGKFINIIGADESFFGTLDVKKSMENYSKNDINILLLHEPDLIDDFSKYPLDLALAGHSHGGQVYIPFYGPIVKNTLSNNYNKGMYNLDNGSRLYVNTGLGNTKFPFRFCNIPEITSFILE